MKYFILFLIIFTQRNMMVFNFSENSNLQNWQVVDDGVMGGKSKGSFTLNDEGNGVFSGHVSLENNGGFSSVRYRFKTLKIKNFNKFKIRLKGDGKAYQFRLKSNAYDNFSYVKEFQTSGKYISSRL